MRTCVLFLTGCFVVGSACAADITLAPGETLDWTANTPAAGDVIKVSGGTIVFSDDADADNIFELSGPADVQIAEGKTVRFLKKWLKRAAGGKMTFNGSFFFGSQDSGGYAFLPADAVAFTPEALAAGARMILRQYVSYTVLPASWENTVPFVYTNGVNNLLYGSDMLPTADGVIRLPTAAAGTITWRASAPDNFASGSSVAVPTNTTLIFRRSDFNEETCTGSSWNGSKVVEWDQDVVLERGSTLYFNHEGNMKFSGRVTGCGTVQVNSRVCMHNLYGSLAGMDAGSELRLDGLWGEKKDGNSATRLNSGFPGRVLLQGTAPTNVVSIGCAPPRSHVRDERGLSLRLRQGHERRVRRPLWRATAVQQEPEAHSGPA